MSILADIVSKDLIILMEYAIKHVEMEKGIIQSVMIITIYLEMGVHLIVLLKEDILVLILLLMIEIIVILKYIM